MIACGLRRTHTVSQGRASEAVTATGGTEPLEHNLLGITQTQCYTRTGTVTFKDDGFNKETCKKLLRDHFIYFDFGHRAKKNTGKKFNQQKESGKNKENRLS